MRRFLTPTACFKLSLALELMLALVSAGTVARAEDRFTYTMRREIHAKDVQSGAVMPLADERAGEESRKSLGVTGRVAIARRMTMVEDGGQVFVFATMPEALAAQPHELDVLIDGPGGMKPRGTIHFDPKGSRRVARLFVIPDLTPGPALVEIHARGVHVAEWQEIVSEDVDVPKNGRLHFSYSLDNSAGSSVPVEIAVEARTIGGGKTYDVMSRKLSPGWQGLHGRPQLPFRGD